MKRIKFLFFCFFFTFFLVHAKYSLLFLNTHNFFDTKDDEKIADDVLSKKQFEEKCKRLAEVVNSVNPDILCLCEVENKKILKYWNKEYLKKQHYRTIVLKIPEDNDYRGIHCALLSRFPLYKGKESIEIIQPYPGSIEILKVILMVKKVKLYIYVNHWKSRIGGVQRTAYKRKIDAAVLRKSVNEILSQNPYADIIICGDFNELYGDEEEDPSIEKVFGATISYKNISQEKFYDCWGALPEKERYDFILFHRYPIGLEHILLSPGMFDKKGIFYIKKSFKVIRKFSYKMGNLYVPDSNYTDHFPISIQFDVK